MLLLSLRAVVKVIDSLYVQIDSHCLHHIQCAMQCAMQCQSPHSHPHLVCGPSVLKSCVKLHSGRFCEFSKILHTVIKGSSFGRCWMVTVCSSATKACTTWTKRQAASMQMGATTCRLPRTQEWLPSGSGWCTTPKPYPGARQLWTPTPWPAYPALSCSTAMINMSSTVPPVQE